MFFAFIAYSPALVALDCSCFIVWGERKKQTWDMIYLSVRGMIITVDGFGKWAPPATLVRCWWNYLVEKTTTQEEQLLTFFFTLTFFPASRGNAFISTCISVLYHFFLPFCNVAWIECLKSVRIPSSLNNAATVIYHAQPFGENWLKF